MLKSRLFGRNSMKRISIYVRHGPKTNNTPQAVLTSTGRKKVIKRTKILPTDTLIFVRTSPTKRTIQTARVVAKKRRIKIELANELNSETLILNQEKFLNYFKNGKKWANFLRDWLDNKLNDFVIPPEIVVKQVLRINELGQTKNSGVFVRLTHAMILEAILEKLTNKKYESLLTARKEFNQHEIDTADGFMLYFTKGRVKLEFRKQHFDVTRNFNRFMN
jgi:broad specificity phosphatase PhoE